MSKALGDDRRRFLEPPALHAERASLRKHLSAEWNLDAEQIWPVASADFAVHLWCQRYLAPGHRVALFEPSPASFRRAVLATGAAYVDCGRALDWSLRLDTAARVLQGGAAALVVASPNWPVPTMDCDALALAVEYQIPALVDRCRGLSGAPVAAGGSHVAQVVRSTKGLVALVAEPSLVNLLERMAPEVPFAQNTGDLASAAESDLAHLAAQLRHAGCEVAEGPAPYIFVQRRGEPVESVVALAVSLGAKVSVRAHHTWREGAVVSLSSMFAEGPGSATRTPG